MTQISTNWWLYLIRMANGHLYCGVTTNIERRFQEHCSNSAKTAKALRNKGPLELVFAYLADNKTQAMQLEYRLKQWPKQQKEQLIKGQIPIQTLLKELPSGK